MRHLVLRSLCLLAMACGLVWLLTPAFAQEGVKLVPRSGPPPGVAVPQAPTGPRAPIRTLIITGHNNHNWQYTSRMHAETLAATGRFTVEITDDPATFMSDANALDRFDLLVVDYNDAHDPRRWGPAAEKSFELRLRLGAGVLLVHAANNAFPEWSQYATIAGLVWREPGSSHDAFGPFELQIPGTNVMTRGFPKTVTITDELYYALENPMQTRIATVAWATSAKTQKAEPLIVSSEYGPGRVVNFALGHVWTDSPETKPSVSNPTFRALFSRACEWAGSGFVTLPAEWTDTRTHNALTDAEKAAGWQLLFDGRSTTGWRGFKKDAFPTEGWSVDSGTLFHKPGSGGGDLVTKDEFGDFELSLDWTVGTGGNSGIMYRCSEEGKDYPWQTGPECQVLDDANHQDGKNKKTSAGSLYDVVAPPVDVVRPAGEWNHARIVAKGTKIEHWLNGFKVVDVDLASDEFKALKAASKWKDSKDYGSLSKGRIALQDHGDEVRYGNIKIRRLDGPAPAPAGK